MRDRFSYTIGRLLSFAEHVGHSLLRVRCIQPSPCRNKQGKIRLVSAWQSSLVQVVTEYPRYFGPLGHILLFLNGRTVRTQQRIDEVCSRIQSGLLCGTGRGSTLLSAREKSRRGREEAGCYHHSNRPHKQSVCGITEIHFVGMDASPFGSQPASQIPSESRSQNLSQDEPHNGPAANRRCRSSVIRPG